MLANDDTSYWAECGAGVPSVWIGGGYGAGGEMEGFIDGQTRSFQLCVRVKHSNAS